ncbi:MAG: hypothetical protein L3J83_04405 [Proteobacteria bacterium]|nr:hypothetical protein [Pseudomonadota bacterium]
MKKVIRNILIVLSFVSTIAIAQEKTTLLISNEKGVHTIDFLNLDGVTALQFDISTGDKSKPVSLKKSSLSSCTVGLASTHTGSCSISKNGNLRVVIYSGSNAVLESGRIGSFKLSDNAENISVSKLLMGTPDMKEIKGEVVFDRQNRKPSINENHNNK